MNCNTTHYRANSSSVPGDPTILVAAPTIGDVLAGKIMWYSRVSHRKTLGGITPRQHLSLVCELEDRDRLDGRGHQ